MNTDARIEKAIWEQISCNCRIDAGNIGISVKDGVVTLHRTVWDDLGDLRPLQLHSRVEGVKEIIEALKIKPRSCKVIADDDMDERLAHLCEWCVIYHRHQPPAEHPNRL
ncbi:BON domain-containing protein [uncultured Roseovarius sp.]|uniref:BON domain-containing protein n=1 Tax=Roseovarius sp. TaxID=1486281 RepID=UPI0025E70529|nr:BON domain-containing protein [uncultured Roseovarius sp.]